MRTLELDLGKIKSRAIKTSTFPAGEPYVKLLSEHIDPLLYEGMPLIITLNAYISSPNDVFELMLVKNALDKMYPSSRYTLNLPYIPFGRQDRSMSYGEPESLKVFAKLLNDMKFDKIITVTPHSDVSGALIDRLEIGNDFNELESFIKDNKLETPVFVAPDAGAMKRIYYAAIACGVEDVICATKIRNAKTGQIVRYDIPPIEHDRNIVVVDDICDGGATFIELAGHVRTMTNKKTLSLYVTHGIFSKGRQVLFDAGFDHVGSTFNFLEKQNG